MSTVKLHPGLKLAHGQRYSTKLIYVAKVTVDPLCPNPKQISVRVEIDTTNHFISGEGKFVRENDGTFSPVGYSPCSFHADNLPPREKGDYNWEGHIPQSYKKAILGVLAPILRRKIEAMEGAIRTQQLEKLRGDVDRSRTDLEHAEANLESAKQHLLEAESALMSFLKGGN